MDDFAVAPPRDELERFRETYADTAGSASWLAAHQWTYGPDVARATARDVREKLMLNPHDRVLEVGSGSGAFLAAVLHEGQRGMGFDFCGEQVRGRDRFGVDRNQIKLSVAEAARIPMRSNSFDKILCYSVVHYFPDDRYVRDAIAEMLRVCRPGGVILLGDVAGVMERTRKNLIHWKLPTVLVDSVLWMLLPLRHVYRAVKGKLPREGRFFRRSILKRILRAMPCDFEFLDQNIAGRPASCCRFDIRITKKG